MADPDFSTFIAWVLAALFAVSALVHLAGLRFIREAYERWNFAPKFYRVTGGIELLAAAFLANPITRIWGIALAALTMFVAVVTLLNNKQYAYTVPGILVMIALIPASLSAAAF
ncbi:MAG: DoxX family protein [Proteobacteria bacterium]|nr:DoxX family protein [Pseudomonadota bacterium]